MDLIIVRHGRPERVEDLAHAADPALTDIGHAQAEAVARFLLGEQVDHVVASPMLRARQTGVQAIAARRKGQQRYSEMAVSLNSGLVYCLLVGLFTAYLTGLAVEPGAGFLEVFRFAGTASFGGYFLALIQNSIWYKRAWSTTLKYLADGFIYALGTAAIFAWLWPA